MGKMMSRFLAVIICFAATIQCASATDLSVISQGTIAGAFRELVPQFENQTGDKINFVLGNPGVTLDRIRKAAPPPDVVIVGTAILGTLLREGLVDPNTRMEIAKSKIGMAVPSGAQKPVVTDKASFTEFIRKVSSIALVDPNGGSGTSPPFIKAIEEMGLAAEIAPKYKYYEGTGENVADAVARGEADIGVTSVSELVPNKGVQVISALPVDVLDWSSVTYALTGAQSQHAAEAAKFINFLRSPPARQAFILIGLE
jgi:molybdate transport system substrate-binding protein